MVVALTIAGSDSIGGAGIQADIKAMASLGVHAASVITCVTSQNTQSVSAILPLPREHVLSQLEAVLGDAEVKSAKTGMLYSGEIASAVAGRLEPEGIPLVVDPVLAAGVGDSLHQRSLLGALQKDLIPLAMVLTPNRQEAEALTGRKVRDLAEAKRACKALADLGPRAVLLKGGHFQGDTVVDLLYYEEELTELHAPRLGVRPHGSGCHLSSYIAASLAMGYGVKEAVAMSRSRVQEALQASYAVGQGLSVLDSLATLNREAARYQVLVQLQESVDSLVHRLSRDWIPEVGMNFVFALPGARYYEDVCGIEGRIIGTREGARRCGCLSFGASRHMARVVLAAMKHDPRCRAALNLRYSLENLRRLRGLGLSSACFDRAEEPDGAKTMEWGTSTAIERFGRMPDLVYDEGGKGKEPMIRVLGQDPGQLLGKLQGLWP